MPNDVPAADAMPAGRGWTLREAMRTPHFWLLFLVYLCTGLGSFFVSLHQLAFAVDIGFDKLYAAQVLGIGAFLAVPGIVVTGTLSDCLGREVSAILAYGFSILGVITIGSGIGSALGSWGAGWIFDVSGSYRVAFMLSIASYAGGVIAFWALRRPPVRLSRAS